MLLLLSLLLVCGVMRECIHAVLVWCALAVHFKWISLHFFLRVVCVSFERVFFCFSMFILSYVLCCAVYGCAC